MKAEQLPHQFTVAWRPGEGGAVFSSITRITDLASRVGEIAPLEREQWATGDYVVGEVENELPLPGHIEVVSGRMVEVAPGDLVVGCLGTRYATLETVGDWRHIGADLRMETLTRAGVFGKAVSSSPQSRPLLVPARYLGHVLDGGAKLAMKDFVAPVERRPLAAPVVLLIGTSMSAGKTTAAKVIVRLLKRRGLAVGGAKFTGVARYREILAMQDAGADFAVDFVDAGLPSTICPAAEFREALQHLCARLAHSGVDVVVAEAGASPLEPYNGDVAVEALGDRVRCTVLCASDPYAVVGVTTAYGVTPDVVAGRATSTDAGVALCERLAGVRAVNLFERRDHGVLDEVLAEKLGL